MVDPSPSEKRKRAYGVSCRPCRQKKISCDGARPRCYGCKDTEEECLVPTSARPLRRLKTTVHPSRGNYVSEASCWELKERMDFMEEKIHRLEAMRDLSPMNFRNSSETPEVTILQSVSGTQSISEAKFPTVAEFEGAKYRLTVDEAGNVMYHGLTSWSQGPNIPNSSLPPQTTSPSHEMTDPTFAPILQALATSKHISVAPRLGDALLEAYFCYQVFNIIQKSVFMRDMALGGQFFSEFLLMSIYASATRMIDGLEMNDKKTQGELFERLAQEYLAKEMQGPTKITTIQGLLLLSGRECALGNVSQGWNHAGLAFRMIHDLGIHLAPEKVVGASYLSFEEQATRDRLFWSAFVWDKSISLALGREPTFQPRIGREPSSMVDFDDVDSPWTPYFVNPFNCPPALMTYVYQPNRRVAAFRFHASLCLILHDIIMELYSTESRLSSRRRMEFIGKTRQRLNDFWKSVPDGMKFTVDKPSPPPWIFMLQIFYHATSILLYRLTVDPTDISTTSGHVPVCLEHSITANQMAVSFTQTFGERMTYVAMYSSFVAASFDILLLEGGSENIQLDALVRLRIWLGIMEQSVIKVPSIRRSVHHISTSTWYLVSQNPALAVTEAGQWIASLHTQQIIDTSPINTFQGNGTGVGSFDFFELFEPLCDS
ncbi:uncharacterized protein TRUGW13939_07581 [Talaromyces rugulosus]|uniref:Zn(2)-C6 fungal-type domain-containing protein n=1 Tax=Talaromyces rugulosus TaxID=121627 RepID=A0A7H8R2T8_TALRU|nr:uncharacterized protein TRUGW13939_07581 [Talaromyces rugulosus]QKX60436.1 hypothetical protein TRUGW13939_07581 [Talaromyces rugulosus]